MAEANNLTENELDLTAIKARVERATPGDWVADDEEMPGNSNLKWWVSTSAWGYDGLAACIVPADAQFIAHARQDVPALVAEVERLREELKQSEGFGVYTLALKMKNDILIEALQAVKSACFGIETNFEIAEIARKALDDVSNNIKSSN